MGFTSGAATFRRFWIQGDGVGRDVDEQFLSKLAARGFDAREATLRSERQMGWIGPNHIFETRLEPERVAVGRFALFALRMDTFAAPGAVLRGYQQLEEEAALHTSGRQYLSRREKGLAREAAVAKLEQEARDGAWRRLASWPVMVDLHEQIAYLGQLGDRSAGIFCELFQDTFGAPLEPIDAPAYATRAATDLGEQRRLDNLEPFHFIEPPDDAAALDLNLTFLGREMLSWLWARTHADEGMLRLSRGGEVAVMIARSMRMECDFKLTGADTLSTDAPTRTPEARAALSIGKQPVKAGLTLGGAAGEFQLTLDAAKLHISSLRAAENEDEKTEKNPLIRLEQRLESIVEAATLVDGLFDVFLAARLSPEWPAEARRMREWAATRKPALQVAG